MYGLSSEKFRSRDVHLMASWTGQAKHQVYYSSKDHVCSCLLLLHAKLLTIPFSDSSGEPPLREWSVEIFLLNQHGEAISANCFDKAVYRLHETFGARQTQSKAVLILLQSGPGQPQEVSKSITNALADGSAQETTLQD